MHELHEQTGQDTKRRFTIDETANTLSTSRKIIYRHHAIHGARRRPDNNTCPRHATRTTPGATASAALPAASGPAEPGQAG